jgi:cytochrome c-type biogenesis protein
VDIGILLWLSFLAGIYAPVGSPCVITLYPGFISFLAGRSGDDGGRFAPLALGVVVAAGVLIALFAGGVLFSFLVQLWGIPVRSVLTPAVFIALLIFSMLLILDIDMVGITQLIPVLRPENPLLAALLLGMIFGVIILPCNAASIAMLLALTVTASGFFEGLGVFLCFGTGMVLPLLIIAGISQAGQRRVLLFLTRHRRLIRGIAGLSMLMIAAWYLALFFFPRSFL